MNLAFFGTPEWAVPSLKALIASDWTVSAVVTNPDRPAGRGYELTPPPVKVAALQAGIEVHQPEKARAPEVATWLQDLAPDVCVVVAYGKILPGELLATPRLGFINLHFSLLPAYRGAAPVQRAVMDGMSTTGVSVMCLTEGMDEGPVLAINEVEIGDRETAGELGERLAEIGAPLLVDSLDDYSAGRLKPVEQDHAAATYAPKISNDEARIDWNRPARTLDHLVRGLSPAPGAWTIFGGTRIKVFRARVESGSGPPGAVLEPERLVVAAGEGALALEDVQMAGKRRMPGPELARGLRPSEGAVFERPE